MVYVVNSEDCSWAHTGPRVALNIGDTCAHYFCTTPVHTGKSCVACGFFAYIVFTTEDFADMYIFVVFNILPLKYSPVIRTCSSQNCISSQNFAFT